MQAKDVMTQKVISVNPDDTILRAIRLMLQNKVSGLPVVDASGELIGIVTQGDFLRRTETATEHRPPQYRSSPCHRMSDLKRFGGGIMTDPFDIAGLRIAPGSSVVARRSERRKYQFVKVPMTWADRLGSAKYAATFKVAHRLLHEHWRGGGLPIQLANVALARNGVSRHQKWRALGELERLGLVRIERRVRKSPIVVVTEDPT